MAYLAAPAFSQAPIQFLEPYPVFTAAETEFLVPPLDVSTGWIELTPLASDAAATVIRLGDREVEDGEMLLRPGMTPGPVLLCSGGSPFAVTCEQIYVERGLVAETTPLTAVDVRFEIGLEVVGRYLLDSWPVAGARVAVVPAGVEATRPYTLPLGMGEKVSAGLRREVVTGEDGRFTVPALAEGEYFLETVLPSGRVHRSDPFALPAAAGLRFALAVDELSSVSWDLGDLDVLGGLALQVQVRDPDGVPIPRARVAARQGLTALDLVSFEGIAGAAGDVWLSGFTVEQAVHLSCRAPGYGAFEQDYELVPVVVECVLEPLAVVIGEVIGPGGEAVPGAVVTMTPQSDAEALSGPPVATRPVAARHEQMVTPATSGSRFVIPDLTPGDWQMTVAAPGHEVLERPLTLAPGERLDLGTIVLLAGTELDGLVIDADSREPVAGAEVLGVDPLGSAWAVSDGDGAFTITTSGDRAIGLEVSADGYATAAVTVRPDRVAAGEALVVELSEAGWLRIVVWEETTDVPCQGCPVTIWPTGTRLRTDRWGEAVSGPLAAGWYNVYRPSVTHLGSAVVAQDDAERRSARVEPDEITTVRFGDQTETVRVVLQPPSEPGWRLSARTPWRTENALRQEDGSFLIHRRSDEVLDLFLVLHDPVADAEAEVWQMTLGADFDAEELVLPLGTAAVDGRATSGGEPIVGERVRLRSLGHKVLATVRSRPDGTFHLPYVPAGVYFLAIGSPNVTAISLRAGQTLDVRTFELIPGGY
ncbi:MAG: hypothetical protein V3T72_22810 [Thermoanaerobaculia bacterium]